MPLDIAEFNAAYQRAKERIDGGADIATEQNQLRAVVPDDASEEHRAFAHAMVERLAVPPAQPRRWSELYQEAGRISGSAFFAEGSVDEKILAIEEARRKIWEIADRATPDEEIHIRAMTRSLEHLERELRDPTFPLDRSDRTD